MKTETIAYKIGEIDNLEELNNLASWIDECKVHLAKKTIKVGDVVEIVQKTKVTEGVVTKINIKKAHVKVLDTTYTCPLGMLRIKEVA